MSRSVTTPQANPLSTSVAVRRSKADRAASATAPFWKKRSRSDISQAIRASPEPPKRSSASTSTPTVSPMKTRSRSATTASASGPTGTSGAGGIADPSARSRSPVGGGGMPVPSSAEEHAAASNSRAPTMARWRRRIGTSWSDPEAMTRQFDGPGQEAPLTGPSSINRSRRTRPGDPPAPNRRGPQTARRGQGSHKCHPGIYRHEASYTPRCHRCHRCQAA